MHWQISTYLCNTGSDFGWYCQRDCVQAHCMCMEEESACGPKVLGGPYQSKCRSVAASDINQSQFLHSVAACLPFGPLFKSPLSSPCLGPQSPQTSGGGESGWGPPSTLTTAEKDKIYVRLWKEDTGGCFFSCRALLLLSWNFTHTNTVSCVSHWKDPCSIFFKKFLNHEEMFLITRML